MAVTSTTTTTVNLVSGNVRFTLHFTPSIDPVTQLLKRGLLVSVQRCQVDGNGKYTDDPTPGSIQQRFEDLDALKVEFPAVATAIDNLWTRLEAFVQAYNNARQLV